MASCILRQYFLDKSAIEKNSFLGINLINLDVPEISIISTGFDKESIRSP